MMNTSPSLASLTDALRWNMERQVMTAPAEIMTYELDAALLTAADYRDQMRACDDDNERVVKTLAWLAVYR